jgi:hypothetical protein
MAYPEYPRPGDSIFRHGTDPDTSPDVSWPGTGLQRAYAEGYRRAASLIVDAILEGRHLGHPDTLLYPVVFLYRHSLELQLKLLVAAGMYHQDGEIDFKRLHTTHRLDHLWERGKRLLLEIRPDAADDASPIAHLDPLVQELHDIDLGGQAFRYSLTKDAQRHDLASAPRTIDLENLRDVMTRVINAVDAALCMVEEAMPGEFQL